MGPLSPHEPRFQDTLNARKEKVSYDQSYLTQMWGEAYPSPKGHSTIEDESDQGEHNYDDIDNDDSSSSLSTTDGTIDLGLVYSLHDFTATAEGQISVVKDDHLVLMDNSNDYWWLVRVLKTQEIGYIPAQNIGTPFKRLARVNKNSSVDVCLLCQLPYTLK